ncbi:MAG: hypothetical protein R2710_00695 [Acidimicrobiales bacterium]
MKKLMAAAFAASLLMSACGSGSDEAADVVAADAASSDGAGEAVTDTGADAEAATDNTASEETTDDTATEETTDDADDAESGGDLSADEQALADALTASSYTEGNPFEKAEVQCANEALVSSVGLETLNSYGITADNPDDTQLPDEYDVQQSRSMPSWDVSTLPARCGPWPPTARSPSATTRSCWR